MLGITGVFWLPRTATVNSTTLWAGAGPVPLSTATPAWAAMSAAYADASFTVTRVLAELAVGWQGVTSVGAKARLAGFKIWADQATAAAAALSAKTGANSIAATTARAVMPSLPEIVAVQTAKVAAYSTGGVLNGTAEAAEAADRAMDIRAALVMEAYEAATTTVVVTPTEFVPPPPIANGVGGGTSETDQTGAQGKSTFMNPVQAAAAAAASFVQNPGVQNAALQAGQVASSAASSVASVASNVGTAAVHAATSHSAAPLATAPLSALPATGFRDASSSSAVRSVSSANIARPANISLPEGWRNSPAPVGGAPVASNSAAVAQSTLGPLDSSAATRAAGAGPMVGHRAGGAESDEENHETPDYLKNFEHFADGRTVTPSVIGADAGRTR
ncbi:PPE domain-containing protein [Antrihabitans stalactiti]|uniref:PPE domain-containing protein n=1 Tax=Antrihabitans stalactiti TaxID=2584121 RepID=A0A848KBX9_9NOCA|nr:PPE domain-containing protein [Antrihabitans stalactiti]NMN95196.1 PPE domain-containing protein [Antrihabitans stalactiti]